jgi:hypothetical protein
MAPGRYRPGRHWTQASARELEGRRHRDHWQPTLALAHSVARCNRGRVSALRLAASPGSRHGELELELGAASLSGVQAGAWEASDSGSPAQPGRPAERRLTLSAYRDGLGQYREG